MQLSARSQIMIYQTFVAAGIDANQTRPSGELISMLTIPAFLASAASTFPLLACDHQKSKIMKAVTTTFGCNLRLQSCANGF